MSKEILSTFTSSLEDFKEKFATLLEEADAEPVAVVDDNNDVLFYAVSPYLFEEMMEYIEYSQRGSTKLISPEESSLGITKEDLVDISENAMKDIEELKKKGRIDKWK
ncbi:conserved hypothetical protein [Hahella chejuensis KCTC 2396]|uniref:Antitoxin n=1 Tax=Hahella chejuensis (strain KCTC 2396) TaxID=349521 RepID=Q2S732_HAHCH|nr:hypothetical protein [Hahella chejuensis]ABC33542.1 conserved hypothetical protein [Hahella chejuensis KCTC 2396]